MKSMYDIMENYEDLKTYFNYPVRYLCDIIDHWTELRTGILALLTEMENIYGNKKKRDSVLKTYFVELRSLMEKKYLEIQTADFNMHSHRNLSDLTHEFESYYRVYMKERDVLHYLMGWIKEEFESPSHFSNKGFESVLKRTRIRIDQNYDRFKQNMKYLLPKVFENQIVKDIESRFRNQNLIIPSKTDLLRRLPEGPVRDRTKKIIEELMKNVDPIAQNEQINLYRIGTPNDFVFYLGSTDHLLPALEKENYLGWFWMKVPSNEWEKRNLPRDLFWNIDRDEFDPNLKLPISRAIYPDRILVVDLETTGTERGTDQIVEIGIVEINLITKKIRFLVNCVVKPRHFWNDYQDAWIFQHSSLTYEEVDRAWVSIDTVLPYLQQLFYQYRATAFAKAFDFGFLRDLGVEIPNQLPCLMEVMTDVCNIPHDYWVTKWPSFSEAWHHYFEVPIKDLHRAGADAFNEAKLALKMIEEGVLKIDIPTPKETQGISGIKSIQPKEIELED